MSHKCSQGGNYSAEKQELKSITDAACETFIIFPHSATAHTLCTKYLNIHNDSATFKWTHCETFK